MNHTSFITALARAGIVVFWFVCLLGFLYAPAALHLFHQKRSLTIFTWPTILDPQYLQQFEKETGIKLYITYYESNQELFSKLQAGSASGYDIILPSDFTVKLMIQEGLVKKIDHSKLSFYSSINKNLMRHYFDPKNEYSVPFFWGVYGIGINKNYFKDKAFPKPDWQLLFNAKKAGYRVGMTDEAREAILLAAFYLFGTVNIEWSRENVDKIIALLMEQKKSVEAYTESRSEYLLTSEAVPVAYALSTDIYKAQGEFPYLDFLLPQEGGFIFIDSIVIPKNTTKDDMIYQFINYLYGAASLEHHTKLYGFCSPLEGAGDNACSYQFDKLHFFENAVPQELVNEIWITVMSKN